MSISTYICEPLQRKLKVKQAPLLEVEISAEHGSPSLGLRHRAYDSALGLQAMVPGENGILTMLSALRLDASVTDLGRLALKDPDAAAKVMKALEKLTLVTPKMDKRGWSLPLPSKSPAEYAFVLRTAAARTAAADVLALLEGM